MRFVWGWLGPGVLSASPLLCSFQQLQARGGWGWPLGREVSGHAAAGLASFAWSLWTVECQKLKGEFLTVQGEEKPWTCAKVSPGELPKSRSMLLIL